MCPLGVPFSIITAPGTVVIHPVDAKRRVELRTEAGSEEAIAKEPSRSIQNEDNKLGLRNGKAMRTPVLREVAHDSVDVLDVIDESAVGVAEAVVDRRAIVVDLRVGNDLRRIAYVLAIEFAKRLYASCCSSESGEPGAPPDP